MDIWAGFLIGLLGSFHCIGMCGPIALALPVFSKSEFQIIIGRILYNVGRVLTYAFMGAMFGLFGNRLVLIGLQQQVSIALGAAMLIYVLIPGKYKTKFASTKIYYGIIGFIKENFSKLYKVQNNRSLFLIGILNRFLPCGFVYVALAGAISTGDFISGSLFMSLFGFGTMPIMLGASMAGKYLTVNLRSKITRLIPVFTFILAVIFILRGLNLGIPYLSPKLVTSPTIQQDVNCH